MKLCSLACVVAWVPFVVYCFRTLHCEETSSHDLYLAISRHALSCADAIDQFGTLPDVAAAHSLMREQVLTRVGRMASKKAGEHVRTFLEEKELPINAVLVSGLVRSMETALLQFPNASKVYVVPFISEWAIMSGNVPLNERDQSSLLGEEMSRKVDHSWINKHSRAEGGDWIAFREFLASEFLPSLVHDIPAHARSKPIVLAVVTHANFMSVGEMARKCRTHYPSGFEPNNNQAFVLKFVFKTYDGCPNRIVDVDSGEGTCVPIAIGMLSSSQILCRRDVGKRCLTQIDKLHLRPSLIAFGEEQLANAELKLRNVKDELSRIAYREGYNDNIGRTKALLGNQSELHSEVSRLERSKCMDEHTIRWVDE